MAEGSLTLLLKNVVKALNIHTWLNRSGFKGEWDYWYIEKTDGKYKKKKPFYTYLNVLKDNADSGPTHVLHCKRDPNHCWARWTPIKQNFGEVPQARVVIKVGPGSTKSIWMGCCLLQALRSALLGWEPRFSYDLLGDKSKTTTFVGRLAPPVIPASGTLPVD